MKRAAFLPLIALALASMACMFIGQPTVAPTTPPAVVVQPTSTRVAAAEATTPPEEPTAAPAEPTLEPTKAEAAPTDTTAAPQSYTEEFDRRNDNWSDPLIVTTQAKGHDPYVKVTVDGGKMRFGIDDKETFVYKFFLPEMPGTQTIEGDFQNKGSLNASIAFVCKANADQTKWYEVRVSAADNFYHVSLYDKSLKVDQNKNPYVEVGKGHLKIEEYYPTKLNHIKVTCADDQITMDFNKGKKVATLNLDTPLDGSGVGIGVMSANLVPATFDIETLTLGVEQ